MPVIRRITDPADPALSAFGAVQQASYHAPETLIPPEYFAPFVAAPHNRLLVAEDGAGGGAGRHAVQFAGQSRF